MGSYNSRRMDDSEPPSVTSDDESDQEIDYAAILQSLISRGQVHLMTDVDNCYEPKIKYKPNTTNLDMSEFSLVTKQSSGLGPPKRKASKCNLTAMLFDREKGMGAYNSFSSANKCRLSNRYLPNEMSTLDNYTGKAFCGTFSKDGNYFITASQDRQIRLYESGNGSYKLFNEINARDVGWSIIDVTFSPCQQNFVYSTWSTSLHLSSIHGDSEHQIPLCLEYTSRRFCIFSVVFSSDGQEIIGGANNGCIYIYDLHNSKLSLHMSAHEYDVNSLAFSDETSQIMYSGSDDGLIKVWDRRTMNEFLPKPVGILAGHMDGVTYIDSKGDGRHLISNSKDQSIKLWDIRAFSGDKAAKNTLKSVHEQTWDYRWQEVPRKLYNSKAKLDGDTSIMTYKGHIVIKTLVRCRFSPIETTGQRYIYTGCGSGKVVIYDALTGKIAQTMSGHSMCVRDADWHPRRNEIITSSWDGVVGRWYYKNKIQSESEDEEDTAIMLEDNSKPRALRRSLRIALKRNKGKRFCASGDLQLT